MCGFCGIKYSLENRSNEFKILCEKLSSSLIHRGPDEEGFFFDEYKKNIYLYHRRLSILEISEKGSQPMQSNCKRYILCFNGEIYNHAKIRNKIDKEFNVPWRGNSDTETLLEAFNYYGIEKTLNLVEGMFAFAMLDKENDKIILGRDLFGEKPLYYFKSDDALIFSSEVHNIEKNFFKVNESAIYQFLHYNYVPSSNCIYKNWTKVEPGEIIEFDHNLNKKKLFNLKDKIFKEIKNFIKPKDYNPLKEFDKIFSKIIKDILVADVDVGVFLSGGIDSSLVAYYAKSFDKNLKTFSIGIDKNKEYDESVEAIKIADYLKTEHKTFFIGNEEIIENLEEAISSFDEPFADSSQILSFILAKKAKDSIKVALTGDGADELFGGYNRHVLALYLKNISELFGENFIYSKTFKNIFNFFFPLSKRLIRKFFAYPNSKIDKLKSFIKVRNEEELIDVLVSNINQYENLNFNYLDVEKINKIKFISENNLFKTIINHDINHYLTNDILVKTDRSAMKNSLETRSPFLNKKLYVLSQNINDCQKIKNFQGKMLLRNIFKQKFPKSLISKKKKGFSYPIVDFFLSRDNTNWIKSIFNVKENNNISLISSEKLECILNDHINKKNDYSNLLWSNLVLNIWLKKKGLIY